MVTHVFKWELARYVRSGQSLAFVFNDARYFVNDTTRRTDPERFSTQQQAIVKVTYLRQL